MAELLLLLFIYLFIIIFFLFLIKLHLLFSLSSFIVFFHFISFVVTHASKTVF